MSSILAAAKWMGVVFDKVKRKYMVGKRVSLWGRALALGLSCSFLKNIPRPVPGSMALHFQFQNFRGPPEIRILSAEIPWRRQTPSRGQRVL